MNRRELLKMLALGSVPFMIPSKLQASFFNAKNITAADFGNFTWGTATAAAQIEGAWNIDGRGSSIWDEFNHKKGNIKDQSNGDVSCDFYNHYASDLNLNKNLGFRAFRFSISWSRILPYGIGQINQKGIDFYNKVIDSCLEAGIEPWICIYHWDLPQALEENGGWLNRDILSWFSNFVEICAQKFGDRVKNWIVINEPLSFTLFGYGIGIHAPGKMGISNFFRSVHHAALCQAEGARVLRNICPDAKIGTGFSCSPIDPHQPDSERDLRAVRRIDAVMNRMFAETSLGWGYPIKDAPVLQRIEKHVVQGDDQKLAFEFDFFGLQNYFRVVVDGNPFIPLLKATSVSPKNLGNPITETNWEVYPEGLYRCVKQFSKYPVKELIITENGAAFKDVLENNEINDIQRVKFFEQYLTGLLRAKKEHDQLKGYFAWTLLDNFEWAEGYKSRFGLVYVDFASQARILKSSGKWFANFLK